MVCDHFEIMCTEHGCQSVFEFSKLFKLKWTSRSPKDLNVFHNVYDDLTKEDVCKEHYVFKKSSEKNLSVTFKATISEILDNIQLNLCIVMKSFIALYLFVWFLFASVCITVKYLYWIYSHSSFIVFHTVYQRHFSFFLTAHFYRFWYALQSSPSFFSCVH